MPALPPRPPDDLLRSEEPCRTVVGIDNFGQTTSLAFSNVQRNPTLPAANFRFVPPAGADVIGE